MFAELATYMFFTFNPPKNFIFEDPISHKYGLLGHTEMHKHKGETSSYAAENNVKTKKKSIYYMTLSRFFQYNSKIKNHPRVLPEAT